MKQFILFYHVPLTSISWNQIYQELLDFASTMNGEDAQKTPVKRPVRRISRELTPVAKLELRAGKTGLHSPTIVG